MAVLPHLASYRFRLADNDAQRTFTLPSYVTKREIVDFYLRQEPSARAPHECGHAIRANVRPNNEIAVDVYGIANWKHEGRPHDFVHDIREATEGVFGHTATVRDNLYTGFDSFSMIVDAARLP